MEKAIRVNSSRLGGSTETVRAEGFAGGPAWSCKKGEGELDGSATGATRSRDARASPGKPWWSGMRSKSLLMVLVALLAVRALFAIGPAFQDSDLISGRRLDRCVTEQAVLNFLDGQTIASSRADGRGLEGITLRRDRISSLIIKPGDYGIVLIEFELEHDGKHLLVYASFRLTTSDSPELHYHGWALFGGQVVGSH
jgi:hypothetical protein